VSVEERVREQSYSLYKDIQRLGFKGVLREQNEKWDRKLKTKAQIIKKGEERGNKNSAQLLLWY